MFILGGEIGLITGLVISQVLYSNYDADYNYYIQLSDISNAEIVRYNRDNAALVRNTCIVGAAGLYIYNIVDGLLTKGKPQFANRNFKFYPHLAQNNLGIGISINL